MGNFNFQTFIECKDLIYMKPRTNVVFRKCVFFTLTLTVILKLDLVSREDPENEATSKKERVVTKE